MTYEEFKNKFPIGSDIRVWYSGLSYLGRIDNYNNSQVLIYWGGSVSYWYNTSEALISNIELVSELVSEVKIETIQENPICPKCSTQMIKKQTEFYGLIDKCLNCGYC